jgi:hypothetical protein
MRKHSWLRLILFVFAAGAQGCVQDPTVPKVDTEPPVALTITVSDSVYVPGGSPDTISVTLTNTLTQSIELDFPTLCKIQVFIRDASNRVVLPKGGSYICGPVPTVIAMAGNTTQTEKFVWTGGQGFTAPDSDTKVPPGIYFVSALISASNYSTVAFPVKIRVAATIP